MAGTKRAKIKKNDQVVVIAGRDKGKRGRVLEVAPTKGRIKVEGVGMIKRHQRAGQTLKAIAAAALSTRKHS